MSHCRGLEGVEERKGKGRGRRGRGRRRRGRRRRRRKDRKKGKINSISVSMSEGKQFGHFASLAIPFISSHVTIQSKQQGQIENQGTGNQTIILGW